MSRRIGVFGLLFSILTGCFKPAPPPKPAPKPEKPGVSVQLKFPVLLLGELNFEGRSDEQSLITTRAIAQLSVYDMTVIDSDLMLYKVQQATGFGMKSVWLDNGRSNYQVFLQFDKGKKIEIEQARQAVLTVIEEKNRRDSYTPHGYEMGKAAIQKCTTVPELIEACDKSWTWR